MKKYFKLLILLPFMAQSQTQFLNLNFDLNSNQPANHQSIDIDNDGIFDLTINSWFLQSDNNKGIELIFDNVSDKFNVISINDLRISDCSNSFLTTSNTAYVYTNNVAYSNYQNQNINSKFTFNGISGTIHVNYLLNSIEIIGFTINEAGNNDCFSLGIEELNTENKYVYFDLLGNKTENLQGFLIQVDEKGFSKKVFYK